MVETSHFKPTPVALTKESPIEVRNGGQAYWLTEHFPAAALLMVVAATAAVFASLAKAPSPQQKLAAFSTTLDGRSKNQRRNAYLAARSIDGKVIPPGGIFSFNQSVQSWSVDQGYVKALVSYDGELVRAYGGGVCQTSTTLYNAALLAGLPILERHPHVFVPHYIAPGRDAAVAFPGIDLRIKNPHPWPIRIHSGLKGSRLEVSLTGMAQSSSAMTVKTELISVTPAQKLTRVEHGLNASRKSFLHSAGTSGYRVRTYRIFDSSHREVLSDDTYPSMDRIVALNRTGD